MRAVVPVAALRQAVRDLRTLEIKNEIGLQERLEHEELREEYLRMVEYITGIEILSANGKPL